VLVFTSADECGDNGSAAAGREGESVSIDQDSLADQSHEQTSNTPQGIYTLVQVYDFLVYKI